MRFLLVLCGFAVLVVQVVGVKRGFVCDLDGSNLVAAGHCHGENTQPCHTEGDEHREDGGSDRHQHREVKGPFNGLSHQAPQFAAAAPAVLAPLWEQVFAPAGLATVLNEHPSDAYCGSPPGAAPSRALVLRI